MSAAAAISRVVVAAKPLLLKSAAAACSSAALRLPSSRSSAVLRGRPLGRFASALTSATVVGDRWMDVGCETGMGTPYQNPLFLASVRLVKITQRLTSLNLGEVGLALFHKRGEGFRGMWRLQEASKALSFFADLRQQLLGLPFFH